MIGSSLFTCASSLKSCIDQVLHLFSSFREESDTISVEYLGINVRHLGIVRRHVPNSVIKGHLLLLTEMIARLIKDKIRKALRATMKVLASFYFTIWN
jgi:hypothetical protein